MAAFSTGVIENRKREVTNIAISVSNESTMAAAAQVEVYFVPEDGVRNAVVYFLHAFIVDEIVIVDTGSTDGTKEIANGYTDLIFDFEWMDDFAAARNYSFGKATKDYLLWLDADDVILDEDQKKLLELKRSLHPSVDSVTMIYNLGADEFGNVSLRYRRNRLVKRERNFRWHGAVHEYLEVGGHILNSDLAVTHRSGHHNSDRNLRIYENRLA